MNTDYKVLENFKPWLSRDTWYTGHANDEEIFYKCAYAAYKEYKYLRMDKLREYIIFNNSLDEDFLEKKAEEYAIKFDVISDFLSANKL